MGEKARSGVTDSAESPSLERPCSWVAEGDENGNQIGPAWCRVHKHDEGTPPPRQITKACPSHDGDTGLRCMRLAGHEGRHWVEFEWEDDKDGE